MWDHMKLKHSYIHLFVVKMMKNNICYCLYCFFVECAVFFAVRTPIRFLSNLAN